MNKLFSILGGIVGGLVIFSILAGLIAAGLTLLRGAEGSSGVWVTIGLTLEAVKWVGASWGGYKIYKYLQSRNTVIH